MKSFYVLPILRTSLAPNATPCVSRLRPSTLIPSQQALSKHFQNVTARVVPRPSLRCFSSSAIAADLNRESPGGSPPNNNSNSGTSSNGESPDQQYPLVFNNLTIDSCNGLADRTYPRYDSVNNSKLKRLIWPRDAPRNIFVMKKPHNDEVSIAMNKLVKHLNRTYPELNVMVTREVADEIVEKKRKQGLSNFNEREKKSGETETSTFSSNSQQPKTSHVRIYTGSFLEIVKKADLLVTLGGDGTILKSASLFADNLVPPVLSFSLGTLGFLLPYDFNNFQEAFHKVYTSRAKVLQRSRLECHIIKRKSSVDKRDIQRQLQAQTSFSSTSTTVINNDEVITRVHAMNDIILHRGSIPHLATLDIYIDGEFLTRATGDGLIISSPTGSTAYSLSAGGSIVHPLVKCILLTPICPRSLSFRPLIIPSTSHIKIKVQKRNSRTSPPQTCHSTPANPLLDSPLEDSYFDKEFGGDYALDDNGRVIHPNQTTTAKLSIDGASHASELSIGDEIHIFNEIGTIFIPGTNLPDYIIKCASPINFAAPESPPAPKSTSSSSSDESATGQKQYLYKVNSTDSRRTNYGGITSGTIIENEHKGVYCVAKGENDWTKGINESLGFNSRFKESRGRVVFDEDDEL